MSSFKSMYKGDRVCVNCRFFYQHYVRSEGRYLECNAGHCYCQRKYAQSKRRKPGDTACEKFAEEVTSWDK